jgi:hypothetical protein
MEGGGGTRPVAELGAVRGSDRGAAALWGNGLMRMVAVKPVIDVRV